MVDGALIVSIPLTFTQVSSLAFSTIIMDLQAFPASAELPCCVRLLCWLQSSEFPAAVQPVLSVATDDFQWREISASSL